MTQLSLPHTTGPAKTIQPAGNRTNPAVWVERVRVVPELRSEPDDFVRDVELRRGLNIIWAPPVTAKKKNELFRSGIAGHTAGKTTFCRLVRYALGEASFASEETRRRIRTKFPTGWLIAQVIVAGRRWAIARPFAIGAHPFCVPDADANEAVAAEHKDNYQVFLDAVASATTENLPVDRFPSREPIAWEHLLPWLTRDQECRFADYLEWRHSSSSSDAPALSADERRFLIRTALGLVGDEERGEQARHAELLDEKRTATQREPLLRHQAAVDHERLQELLGVNLEHPASELFGATARDELDKRRSALTAKLQELAASDRRAEAREASDRALRAEENAVRDVEDAERRLAIEKNALEIAEGRALDEEQEALVTALPPPGDYCNVPLKMARESGCPLAVGKPFDLAEKRHERTAAAEAQKQRQLIEALQGAVSEKLTALEAAQKAAKTARLADLKSSTAYHEKRSGLLIEQTRLEQIEALIEHAERSWQRAEATQRKLDDLEAAVVASRDRQEALRRANNEALGRFSDTFEYVCRALLGGEISARIHSSGRSLALNIDHNGERDSAAIATVKLLAFDLAALTASIEGHGSFPRFLLHDGPREADLAPDIYERLFLYAHQLETCLDGPPAFQYIVTTTTAPPQRLVRKPWIAARLSGLPAAERLLRTDL